jgi:predicted XRE-type DNA-binding protein
MNYRHLRWVTRAENVADMKTDDSQPVGQRHWNAKLAATDVRAVRSLIDQGVSQRSIAQRFGISQVTVSDIARGVGWAHLP